MVTLALRMPLPPAVVTRPASDTPAAVVGGKSIPHPQIDPTTTFGLAVPASSLTYRLHVPFAFVNPNVLVSVGTPLELGSMYGAAGAGAGKLDCGASQLTGLKLPVTS